MKPKDPRKKSRREDERRIVERRVITHPFGSSEWVKEIQQDYLLWPKVDRRTNDRRCEVRRKDVRRTSSVESWNTQKMYDLLTAEEKEMLNELSQKQD